MAFIYDKTEVQTFNTIALRGIVIFPGITTSFELGRKMSVSSLRAASEQNELVYLAIQKNPAVDEPDGDDLFDVGVVARIANVLRLTNGNYQVMAEGLYRAKRVMTVCEDGRLISDVLQYPKRNVSPMHTRKAIENLWTVFNDYLHYVTKPSPEILDEIHRVEDAGLLSDFLASNFLTNFDDFF